MREVKFRVWDKIANRWYHSTQLVISPYSGSITDGSLSLDKYVIVQRFTGLKDKNGKEIYEGDIIRSLGEDLVSIFGDNPIYTYGEIKWLCQAFKVCQSRIGATYLGDFVDCDCCNTKLEIIGNIFENPDLLK